MKKKSTILSWLLAVLLIMFIWGNSGNLFAQSVADSAGQANIETLQVSTVKVPYLGGTPSAGDNCDNPIVVNIPANLPYSNLGQTTSGRGNTYIPYPEKYSGGEDIIYRLNVFAQTEVVITMKPKLTNSTMLGLFDDCPVTNFGPGHYWVVRGEDMSWRVIKKVLYPGSYYLLIDVLEGYVADFDLTISQRPLPTIITAFPFIENFETTSTTLDDWRMIHENGEFDWIFRTGSGTSNSTITTAAEGIRNACFESSSYNLITKFVTPPLNLSSVVNPQLSFYLTQEARSGKVNFTKIYYRTGTTAPWVEIANYNTAINVWTKMELELPNPSATYQIAFEGIDNYGMANTIDLVKVYAGTPIVPGAATNVAPLNNATNIENGSLLTWTFGANTAEYQVMLGTTNPPTAVAVGFTTTLANSYTLKDLTPNTTYYWRVNARNRGVTTSGPVSSFTAVATPISTFPFIEFFETSSTTLANWSQIQEIGTSNWTFEAGAGNGSITSAYVGKRNARFIGNINRGFKTKLVSPPLNLSNISFPKLHFVLGQEHWNAEQNTTKVYYRTSATSPWIELANYTNSISAWTPIELELPNRSASYQIAFEGTNNYGYANVIDMVAVFVSTPPSVVTTFPFIESFETTSTTLDDWRQICENGDANWTFDVGAGNGSITSAYVGTSNARFIGNINRGFKTKLVSPPLNLSNLSFPKLSFYLGQEYWNGEQNTTKVFYRTSTNSPWVQLEEYTNSIDEWTLFEIELPNPSASYQLAFEGTNDYGYANVIDLVKVYEVPPTVITTFPFIESFETTSTTLASWRQICENGNANWTFNAGAGSGSITNAFDGTRNARFIDNGDYGYKTKLITPSLNLSSISLPKLSFYLGQEGWGDDQNTTKVFYRTSTTSPWVQLEEYTNSLDVWTKFEIDLPNPSATYQLAFEGTNNHGYANVIDMVEVYEAGTPPSVVTTFPFIESFETTSTTLASWRQICENGNANWTFNAGAGSGSITNAFDGTRNARFISNNQRGYKTKLVSPPLNLSSISSPKLSFYLGQEIWSSDQNTTKVFYRTSATSPWVELANYTNSIDDWTKFELELPNPSATYQIAFEGDNDWGYANVIDLVKVQNVGIQETLNLTNRNIESGSNECFNATRDITVAGGLTSVVVENNASAEFIAGQSIRFLPGFHAVSGSYVYGHITTTGNFCTPMPLGAALVLPEEKSIEVETPPSDQSKLQGEKSIKIYPNPSNGQFTVELSNFESRSSIVLVNAMGSIVFKGTINDNEPTQFELLNFNKGIYILQVRNGNTAISKKIVVN